MLQPMRSPAIWLALTFLLPAPAAAQSIEPSTVLAVSPDGRRVITGNREGQVIEWNARSLRRGRIHVRAHSSADEPAIRLVGFLGGRPFWADGEAVRYPRATQRVPRSRAGYIFTIAGAPNGDVVYANGDGGAYRVGPERRPSPVVPAQFVDALGDADEWRNVGISPSGALLALTSDTHRVALFEAGEREPRWVHRTEIGPAGLGFSADEQKLCVTHYEDARVLSTTDGSELHRLSVPRAFHCSFSDDGQTLRTARREGQEVVLQTFDLATGAETRQGRTAFGQPHPQPSAAVFLADDRALVADGLHPKPARVRLTPPS